MRLVPSQITKIEPEHLPNESFLWVYNIETEGNHNYLANKILVHNCDDPNSAQDAFSKVSLKNCSDWWDTTMASRAENFKTVRRIIVQQRISEDDLTGHILAKEDGSWLHLRLPMEFEEDNQCRIQIDDEAWTDPRKTSGELLWPEGIGRSELETLKADMNYDGYRISGQLQQRPSPLKDGILEADWFQWWDEDYMPPFKYILQSWDTALTGNTTSCYSACTTWGVFTHNNVKNIMLLSVFREKVEYPDLRKMAIRLAENYEDVFMNEPPLKNTMNEKKAPHQILIEQKVSGYSLLQDLLRANLPVLKFNPNEYGDKIGRCRLVSHLMENGLVWLPTAKPHHKHLTQDAKLFLEAASTFPSSSSNDIVDSMSQAFIRLISSSWVSNTQDPGLPKQQEWRKNKIKFT